MNIDSSLITELRDKAYRDAYVASQIRIGLPFQARALRQARGLTQEQLAALAGMSQPRIAEIEKPGKRQFNLETLLRIASAFDVGLEVRFVPLSQIVRNNELFDPETFNVKPFAHELADAEKHHRLKAASAAVVRAYQDHQRAMPVTLWYCSGQGSTLGNNQRMDRSLRTEFETVSRAFDVGADLYSRWSTYATESSKTGAATEALDAPPAGGSTRPPLRDFTGIQ